jgi:8-oxo-dGTP diphosphatase
MSEEFLPYEAPILTVDAVVFQIIDNELQVLLIERNRAPFKGVLALPGGYNPRGETTLDALNRVLIRKTGIGTDSSASSTIISILPKMPLRL